MEPKLITDMDSWTTFEPDERGVIADPYSLDYDGESEMDDWYEEQAREARQLREDAEEAIWDAEQLYGDPLTDAVRSAAVEHVITAHHDERNAGRDGDIVFAGYNALQAIYAALPKPRRPPPIFVAACRVRPGQQGRVGQERAGQREPAGPAPPAYQTILTYR